jgi:sortase (surface protein transpeptidase)
MIQPARRSPTGPWLLIAALTLTACNAHSSALGQTIVSSTSTVPLTRVITTTSTVPAMSPPTTPATYAPVTLTPLTVPATTGVPAVKSGANVNADPAIGDPISISIPSIGVESLLVPTGELPDATMAVPKDASIAGWFTGGPKPGERGPAVIMGHVDQKTTGPGVFWHLRDLQIGAEVTIHTTNGDVVFVAVESDLINKDEFPTDRVYGAVPTPELRLITCGGSFDRKIGHYRSNVIVYLVPKVAP